MRLQQVRRWEFAKSRLHQSIYHPNIITLFTSFADGQACYHLLEYCPYGSLDEYLSSRAGKVLCDTEARCLFRALANALMYLESFSIIHRNVDPSNILIAAHRVFVSFLVSCK